MTQLRDFLRAHRAATVAGALTVAALLAVVAVGCHRDDPAHVEKWYCPMHPTYVADHPGDCPICNMRLVPFEKEGGGGNALAAPTTPDAAPAGAVKDLAEVTVDEQGVRLTGVRTAQAVRATVSRPTRAVGLVVPDERSVRHVHTKIMGWVEKLHVNFTGQPVRAGQPILSLYSPELLASQQELLRALEAAARFAGSSLPEVRKGGAELAAAARQRLELFDVPKSFIARIERSGQPERTVTLTAPVSGFVTAKQVFEGQQVQPGMELYTITDLSRVWVEADFYEYEAQLLRVGQPAEVRLPYDPGHGMRAQISFIYPTLQPESRTLKVRLELANADNHMKPGMYVDVLTQLAPGEGVTVPDDAVIDTGTRQVVFVQRQPGSFEPREVRIGVRGEGRALVLAGVREGELVATRANFLLDSESRLRAAIANLKPAPGPPGDNAGHGR